MRQGESARSMGKSGGEKMRSPRPARARAAGGKQAEMQGETAAAGEAESLRREAERLREELAIERERTERLHKANISVAARLNAAIASIKQLLERRG
jgi:hypothetical protein